MASSPDEIINTGFFVALMEDLQDQEVEESDEERLNSVIQSLKAEINSNVSDSDYSRMEHGDRLKQMDGLDWPVSFDDLEMSYDSIDMESVISPSYDPNLYMYPCGDHELNCGDLGLFEGLIVDPLGVGLDLGHGYNSLWQETTYDSVMYP